MKLTDNEKALAQRFARALTRRAGSGSQAAHKYGIKLTSLYNWRMGIKAPNRQNFERLKEIYLAGYPQTTHD